MAKSKKSKKSRPRKKARSVKSSKKKPPKKKRKKRRKKRATKAVFQARPREEKPPEGFILNLGEVIQDEAYAIIRARLDDALAALPEGLIGNVTVVPLADGSVDGELYIQVPEGTTTSDTEWDLYESFGKIAVGSKYWISVGLRYIGTTDDERYKRNKGMTEVQTNYQRATQTNIVEEHLILRRYLIPGMEKKMVEEEQPQEAHSIFIRLHWNQTDEQPKR